MAAVLESNVPVTANMAVPKTQEELNSEMLAAFAVGLGMDPNTKNELQVPDLDYLQQAAKLPINFAEVPSGTDVEAMRNWIKTVIAGGALDEDRAKLDIPRRRQKQDIDKSIISIKSPGDNDSFELWVYETRLAEGTERKPTSRSAILMFHGGGWIHGNPFGDEPMAHIFASELDAVIFGVDYRLAPEHKFPAPLDDCNEALEWVIRNAANYNIDTNRIALWGASAGGNLAAGLAVKYAMAQPSTTQPKLCLVSLVVPVTAHPKALALFEEQRSLPKSQNEELFANVPPPPEQVLVELEKLFGLYIDDSTDPCDPLLSPLVARPVSQHPPTYITVAACDHLRGQGQAYAEVLRSVGVQVTEDILPGVPHTFTFSLNTNVTKNWLKRQVDSFAAAFDLE